MADIKDGFFKRAAEWLVLAGILIGWGITLGTWSNRLDAVEVATIKTTAEVALLKSDQIKVLAELPHIKDSLDNIQRGVEKLDSKLDKHIDIAR